jgi:hypothetical protein
VHSDPEYLAAFEEAKEEFLDRCQRKLDRLMFDADDETIQMKTAMFFLEKLGAKRGFGVHQQIDLNHNALPSLVIDFADPRDKTEKIAERCTDEIEAAGRPAITMGIGMVDGVAESIVLNKDVTKGYE